MRGPDGFRYRLKQDGAGFIGMRLPAEKGLKPTYIRPPEGQTWTADQAAGKIVEETTPEGAVSQIQLDLDDVAELALFVAPGNEDLASMVARKATQKELEHLQFFKKHF